MKTSALLLSGLCLILVACENDGLDEAANHNERNSSDIGRVTKSSAAANSSIAQSTTHPDDEVNQTEITDPIELLYISVRQEQLDLDGIEHRLLEIQPNGGMWKNFAEMHGEHTQSFVESSGFGLSRTIHMPMPPNKCVALDDADYKRTGMQLVGLLLSDEPVAYRTPTERFKSFIYKDKEKEKRELSEFERQAIDQLRDGEEVVFSDPGKHRIAVGALRADASCIKCHNEAKEGDLLGAFTYALARYGEPYNVQ